MRVFYKKKAPASVVHQRVPTADPEMVEAKRASNSIPENGLLENDDASFANTC